MLVELTTGSNNLVAMSAVKIEADPNIRSIEPIKRNCRFPDENEGLKIYKSYKQSNCQLECLLSLAQEALLREENETGRPCTPWYFPFQDVTSRYCDPWQAKRFRELMSTAGNKNSCKHCLPGVNFINIMCADFLVQNSCVQLFYTHVLTYVQCGLTSFLAKENAHKMLMKLTTDCQNTIYNPKVSTIPFKMCDETNLGLSSLCNFVSKYYLLPSIFDMFFRQNVIKFVKRLQTSFITVICHIYSVL